MGDLVNMGNSSWGKWAESLLDGVWNHGNDSGVGGDAATKKGGTSKDDKAKPLLKDEAGDALKARGVYSNKDETFFPNASENIIARAAAAYPFMFARYL